MDKKEVISLQKKLCENLMNEYYHQKGFSLDRKEWGFSRNNIQIPFFAMTTRGPFFTISPSIVFRNQMLLDSINSIVENPILTNGIFILGRELDDFFEISNFHIETDHKVIEVANQYRWQIFAEEDLGWVKEWHMSYMDAVGWKLIQNLETDESIYNFYKKIFVNWTNDDAQLNIFERSYALDMGAHTTLIFLGLRYQFDDIAELIELTRKHLPNSLHLMRAEELNEHFSKID